MWTENGLGRIMLADWRRERRLLADRRDELGAARTLTINRLHRLLVELVPGGAKKALTARQARALLAGPPAGDAAGDVVRETRRQLAAELVDELAVIDARIKTAKKQLAVLVAETGSGLMQLNGIGPSGAALLGCPPTVVYGTVSVPAMSNRRWNELCTVVAIAQGVDHALQDPERA